MTNKKAEAVRGKKKGGAQMVYHELSCLIVDSFYEVHREIGPGLLEVPYHNALYLSLRKKGLNVKYEFPLPVFFKEDQVGEYFADLLVNGKIVIEVKSVSAFNSDHISQILNYLHISKCRLGFLVNFQNSSLRFKRLVL